MHLKIGVALRVWVIVLSQWLLPNCSFAEDNPFGLPTPLFADQPGAVMLHGGGSGLSHEICEEFVRLAGGKRAHIVLIPSEDYQFGKDRRGKAIAETGAQYERRVLRDYTRWASLEKQGRAASVKVLFRNPADDPDEKAFYTLLDEATGVWLPTAYNDTLAEEFAKNYPQETSPFQIALRKVVSRGGVVGGLGGGMNSLSETVITKNVDGEDGWHRAELRFGLALFNGAIGDQNFDRHAGRLERMTDLLRNGPTIDRLTQTPGIERRTIGLGVDRGAAMILQRNTVRVLGDGTGHIFLKSNGDRTISWRIVEPDDAPVTIASSHNRSPERNGERDNFDWRRFNPFGLPEPHDPDKLGTVVLHGGGDTEEMMNIYPTLAGVALPKMVHCPAARASCRPGANLGGISLEEHLNRTFKEWRSLVPQRRLDNLVFLTTNDPADANRDEFVRPLKLANALWFCGGDQNPLAMLFVDREHATKFQREASEIVARGGVVGGSSAGLAIMPEIMISGGDSDDGSPAQADLAFGLGLLKNVIAEQHFDTRRGRIERLTDLLRDHKRLLKVAPECNPGHLIGLAVEEDTALILRGNRMRVSGKKLAHIFVQSDDPRTMVWHALHAGDHAIMLRHGSEFVLLPEDWSFEN